MTTAEALQVRIEAIEAEIRAVEARLPAHSVKPPLMIQLFALEDEREALLKQLSASRELSAEPPGGAS